MSVPGVFDLTGDHAIYSGSDWSQSFGFYEPAGFLTVDAAGLPALQITSGSATATFAPGGFTTAMTGKKIATQDGSGITDGTTFTYVNATTITLSANATATGTVVASVMSLDMSAFGSHLCQVRRTETSPNPPLAVVTVGASRVTVGWFTLSLANAVTEPRGESGVWDWRVTSAGSQLFLLGGKAQFRKNVSQ